MRRSNGLLFLGLAILAPGVPAKVTAQTPVTFPQAMIMIVERNERWWAADLSVRRAKEAREEQSVRSRPT